MSRGSIRLLARRIAAERSAAFVARPRRGSVLKSIEINARQARRRLESLKKTSRESDVEGVAGAGTASSTQGQGQGQEQGMEQEV